MVDKRIADLPVADEINDFDRFHIVQDKIDSTAYFRDIRDASQADAENLLAASQAALDEVTSVYVAFKNKYLGPLASDPTTTLDNLPLQRGQLYYNTVSKKLKVYIGNTWLFMSAFSEVEDYVFSGNGSTTSFTLDTQIAARDCLFVFVDGVLYEDFLFNGDTVVLATAPSSGTNNITIKHIVNTNILDAPEISFDDSTAHLLSTSVSGAITALSNYADTKIAASGGGGAVGITGAIHPYPAGNTAPAGFLMCDGSAYSKVTYDSLYSVIGDAYTEYVIDNPYPHKSQFLFNNYSGDPYFSNISIPVDSRTSTIFVRYKNFVYAIGGLLSGVLTNSIKRASITGGVLSSFSSIANYPTTIEYAASTTTEDYIYIFGGKISTGSITTVRKGAVDVNGDITWSTTTALPSAISIGTAFEMDGYMFVAGGGGTSHYFFRGLIDVNGDISSWVTLNSWTYETSNRSGTLCGRYLYIQTTLGTLDVYRCASGNLTFVKRYTGFASTSAIEAIFSTNGNIYFIHRTSSGFYKASLDSTGLVNGEFTYIEANIDTAITPCDVITTSSNIYLIGIGGGVTSVTRVSPFTGGLDDYTGYYTGTFTQPTDFRVPSYQPSSQYDAIISI